jgi:cyclic pyranopterin phosphate synthase
MPFNGNSWEWDKTVSFKEMMEKIDTRFNYSRLHDTPQSTAKSFRVEGYKGTFAVISSVTSPFCEGCNRIRLTADGKLKNCLFAQNETDLLTALRNGEDVHDLILSSVEQKKFERGGLPDFKEPVASESYDRNRMMTAIGG